MFVWIVYPEGWVLPAAGFLVGYITNWLAMNLIYEPREPVQVGPFKIQGVFIKRQREVASQFADVLDDAVAHYQQTVRQRERQESSHRFTQDVVAFLRKLPESEEVNALLHRADLMNHPESATS